MATAPTPLSSSVLVNRWNAVKAALVSKAPGTAAALVSSVFARDACVVYVPTAAGATGLSALEGFFRKVADHNEIVTDEKIINRVISASAIAEESILTIVHDSPIEWLLPDVKPTKRRVLIPMSTYVLFDAEGKIKAMRVYWDQGSVMKQIGLLPVSMFCKANNSETVPPVLGPKIVDRLVDAHAEPNLIVKEHWEDAPSAGAPSGKNHEPAHGILPSGDDDQDLHDAGARRLARASNGSLKSRFDEDAPIHASSLGGSGGSSLARGGGGGGGGASEMADILENKPLSDTTTAVRSSTRIHHAQAAKTSDIFNTEPSPPRPPRHAVAAPAAEDDSAPAAGIRRPSSSSSSSTTTAPTTTTRRRDPNWSSINNAADGDFTTPPLVTGKKIFKQQPSTGTDTRGGGGGGRRGPDDDAGVDYTTVGKKHFTAAVAAAEHHFDFAPTAAGAGAGATTAAEHPVTTTTGYANTGRKHSALANRDNNIFGYDKPTTAGSGGGEASTLLNPAARTGRSGKRDPNARSTEHDIDVRPSSRVLGPPGGKQSFSFA
ncbi:hypothetical protein HDU86_002939 [Geranomyces michiganensis]|nr:hypothetical protein HDU86_002939 [Geranomyces michiganensis]